MYTKYDQAKEEVRSQRLLNTEALSYVSERGQVAKYHVCQGCNIRQATVDAEIQIRICPPSASRSYMLFTQLALVLESPRPITFLDRQLAKCLALNWAWALRL